MVKHGAGARKRPCVRDDSTLCPWCPSMKNCVFFMILHEFNVEARRQNTVMVAEKLGFRTFCQHVVAFVSPKSLLQTFCGHIFDTTQRDRSKVIAGTFCATTKHRHKIAWRQYWQSHHMRDYWHSWESIFWRAPRLCHIVECLLSSNCMGFRIVNVKA